MHRSLALLWTWPLLGCTARPIEPAAPAIAVAQNEVAAQSDAIEVDAFEVAVPGSTAKLKFLRVAGPNLRTYWLSETEVPWEAYDSFVFGFDLPRDQRAAQWDAQSRASRPYGSPDRGWGHEGYAALAVTAHAAEAFCQWLGASAALPLRLPEEGEWETAALDGEALPKDAQRQVVEARRIPAGLGQAVGWSASTGPRALALGELEPNSYGLRGMLGNVGEWVRESSGGSYVLAGGHFLDSVAECTASRRERYAPSWNATDPQNPKSRWWLSDAPFAGFRILCEAPPALSPGPLPEFP